MASFKVGPVVASVAVALWAAGALMTAGAGCGGAQTEALQQRVAALEAQNQQLAQMDKRLSDLEFSSRDLSESMDEMTRNLQGLVATFSGIEASLDAVTARLGDVADRLDRGAPSAPPPSYARRPQPDPKAVYSVPVAGSPFRGPADAKVTIVRAFEFACPYCERSRATMDQLRRDYPDELRIVYKHFIVHPQTATEPARAACAADMQGQFFDMERAIWEHAFKAGRDFSDRNLEDIARRVGLDVARFNRDRAGKRCRDRIDEDRALLSRVGVRGTPGFYINGRYLSGARPIQQFKTVIDEELAKADKVMRTKRIRRRHYYDYVVKLGKNKLD